MVSRTVGESHTHVTCHLNRNGTLVHFLRCKQPRLSSRKRFLRASKGVMRRTQLLSGCAIVCFQPSDHSTRVPQKCFLLIKIQCFVFQKSSYASIPSFTWFIWRFLKSGKYIYIYISIQWDHSSRQNTKHVRLRLCKLQYFIHLKYEYPYFGIVAPY